MLKEFTDRLVNTYQNGTDDQRARIDLCTANAMKVDNNYPFYECYRYVDDGGDSSDGNLARYELGTTSTWPSTFANTYELTTFDKLVGWSRWMYLNPTPPPAWSPSSFNFVLPEDKVTELPN